MSERHGPKDRSGTHPGWLALALVAANFMKIHGATSNTAVNTGGRAGDFRFTPAEFRGNVATTAFAPPEFRGRGHEFSARRPAVHRFHHPYLHPYSLFTQCISHVIAQSVYSRERLATGRCFVRRESDPETRTESPLRTRVRQ